MATDSGEAGTRPKNEEAYDLYLRSIALPHDPLPNKDAIAMLERAVGLDPTYAPAWAYLGVRYHYDGAYANGGDEARQRSDAAFERAISLDPNYILAVAWLITNRVEQSQLAQAYQDAKALVARHPENAQARFALSYVFAMAEPWRNPPTNVTSRCHLIPVTSCCARAPSPSTSLATTHAQWIFFSSTPGRIWAN